MSSNFSQTTKSTGNRETEENLKGTLFVPLADKSIPFIKVNATKKG